MSIEAIRAALEAVQDPCPEGFDEDTPHDVRAFIAMGSRRNAIRALQDACTPSAIRELLDRLSAVEAERDRLAAECEALRAALSAILKSPTGCQFCDYGKPRLSIRTGSPCEHDEGCGFVLAHAAMGGKESQGGNGSGQHKDQP